MTAAAQAVPALGPVAACEALAVSRASLHRLQNPPPQPPEPLERPSPPRALTAGECLASTILPGQRQLFFPIGDNYFQRSLPL